MKKIDEKRMEAYYSYYTTKIGLVFKIARTSLSLSQEDVLHFGYTRRVAQSFESKRKNATLADLVKLILSFELDPNQILKIPADHLKKLDAGICISEEEIFERIDKAKLKKQK